MTGAILVWLAVRLAGYPDAAWLISYTTMVAGLAYRLFVDSGSGFMSKNELIGILLMLGGIGVLYALRRAGHDQAASFLSIVLMLIVAIAMLNRQLNERNKSNSPAAVTYGHLLIPTLS